VSEYSSNNGNADFADLADDADERRLSGCPELPFQKNHGALRTEA
jgi:hypothetical protein